MARRYKVKNGKKIDLDKVREKKEVGKRNGNKKKTRRYSS